MTKGYKSGFVSLVGRTNVGKSTLINQLMHFPISIVSDKPQTTRNAIRFILSEEDFQMVFVDTPGMHKPKNKLSDAMVQSSLQALHDVDVVVFVTEPCATLGGGDRFLLDKIKDADCSVIAAINKIDNADASLVAKTITELSAYPFLKEIVPISAAKAKNIEDLLSTIKKYLPEGEAFFDESMMTDRSERFLTAEIIREKVLHYLRDEVPHGVGVHIASMQWDANTKSYTIEALIYVERDSHKAIVIGKAGSMLKRIGIAARSDIERLLQVHTRLNLFVKVKKDWRSNATVLKELGYDEFTQK